MGKEIEIIPPSRVATIAAGREVSAYIAPENPGGIVSSALMRWEANRHSRTFGALTARTRAQAEYFDAQTGAIDSYIKRARAGQRLAELPEILAVDSARRRADRAEELREIQHQSELAEHRRMTEMTVAQTALVDAQQALRAQREFGYLKHELAWKKQHCEMVGVELDAAERRALLAEAQTSTAAPPTTEQLIEQLYAAREQLRADGLDTARVDAALNRAGKQ